MLYNDCIILCDYQGHFKIVPGGQDDPRYGGSAGGFVAKAESKDIPERMLGDFAWVCKNVDTPASEVITKFLDEIDEFKELHYPTV